MINHWIFGCSCLISGWTDGWVTRFCFPGIEKKQTSDTLKDDEPSATGYITKLWKFPQILVDSRQVAHLWHWHWQQGPCFPSRRCLLAMFDDLKASKCFRIVTSYHGYDIILVGPKFYFTHFSKSEAFYYNFNNFQGHPSKSRLGQT